MFRTLRRGRGRFGGLLGGRGVYLRPGGCWWGRSLVGWRNPRARLRGRRGATRFLRFRRWGRSLLDRGRLAGPSSADGLHGSGFSFLFHRRRDGFCLSARALGLGGRRLAGARPSGRRGPGCLHAYYLASFRLLSAPSEACSLPMRQSLAAPTDCPLREKHGSNACHALAVAYFAVI